MEKDRKKQYKKALLWFFAAMAVFTVVSRVTASMTVPKVEVDKAESGRIVYNLKGNGTIEATEKDTYLIPAGVLVESVQNDGNRVEAGDVLIQFQKEYLEQKKEDLETALEKAQLQLKQAKLTQGGEAWLPSAEAAQKNLGQAQADYDQAAAVRQQTADAYEQNVDTLTQDLEAAKEQAEQEKEKLGEEAYQQKIEEAETQFSQNKAELDTKLSEAESSLSQASTALSQAQENLEEAQEQDEVTSRNQEKSKQAADYTVESSQIDVDTVQENLEQIQELIAQDGKMYAAQKGIFSNTAVQEGMVTSGGEFISIGTGGFEFTAEIPKEAGTKIAVGDSISIKAAGTNAEEVQVSQITSEQSQEDDSTEEKMLLKAELTGEAYTANGYAAFSIKKESEEAYDSILPLTAIRQDSKGYYCLGIRTSESVLGEEVKAERINLTLLDQDDTQAAVKGAIQPDTEIIIASEKDVLAGDRVRVEK